jgi:ribosomal protein S12 methylthiotransferase accessory factor YcaO
MSSASVSHRSRQNWDLRPSPKYASHGVVRTVPPAETVRRVLPLMRAVGVTRLGEVTNLDRVGIPNYTAVRPGGLDGISYYNGKGATRLDAKAGALMEAIERAGAEQCDLPVYYCTREAMERTGSTIDPAELIVPHVQPYVPELEIEWVEGFDLLLQQPTYVPLNAVVCPYRPPAGRPMLHWTSSNGVASGNTIEEALCHAICEVIERDAEAVAHTALRLKPAVDQVLSTIGLRPSETPERAKNFSRISLDTLPPRSAALVDKLTEAGLKVYLRNATSTAGIPTFECVIVEAQQEGFHLAHGGSGTHPDARVAISRAITEAAQSRVGCIQGGREDLPEFVKGATRFDPDQMYGRGDSVSFSSIASYVHDDISDDIRFMLQKLAEAGFKQVVAVNLTRPEIGIPVVRVIIPRAEAWPVFQMHARRGTFGARIADLLQVTDSLADEAEEESHG